MALEKFESKAGPKPTAGKLPFLSEFMESNPDAVGNNYEIVKVKETNSRSGYLIETKAFMACLFKSNEQVDELLELIEEVYSNMHCAVYVIIDEEEPSGLSLAYDLEAKRTWVRTKKFPAGYLYAHATRGQKRKPPRNLAEGS